MKCQAGCPTEDVVAALGLAMRDLRPPRRRGPGIVAEYNYVDESGRLLYQVVRLDGHRFRQRRPDGAGGWVEGPGALGGVRRVLFRLPNVLQAVAAGRTVYVVEGEKDVQALERAGEVATTNPGGAGNWRDDYAKPLSGAATVVVLADKDLAGRAHAAKVAGSLRPYVGRVIVAEAKVGKDAADHLAAGHTVADFEVVADGLREHGPEPSTLAPTADLLDQVCTVLRRFVVFGSGQQVDFVALWVLHTWVFDLFDTTPYLDVSSAAKRSGKSRLLELLDLLVARPWPVVEASEAVLFRKVDKEQPTLLVDEVDATFGKDSSVTEGIRAIYNAGYRSGAKVPRCVGNSHEPHDFTVYCPKAFAGLVGLPDTVRDRSGRIQLRRRARHEPKPERLRLSKVRAELAPLGATLAAWAAGVRQDLAGAEPDLPDELSDRAQDGVEALAAIADLAGGEWPARARKAFVAVMGAEEEEDYGVVLLGHVREAFDALGVDLYGGTLDRITTADLLDALVHRGDDSPWAAWWGKEVEEGKILKASQGLARLLRPFGVTPKQVRFGKASVKGFERSAFEDSWSRYVAPS